MLWIGRFAPDADGKSLEPKSQNRTRHSDSSVLVSYLF